MSLCGDYGDVNIEANLNLASASPWDNYCAHAMEQGARAAFSFPVNIGAARIGALVMYRDAVGPLSDSQFVDAHLLASIIARAVLALQAGAHGERLSSELERAATFDFAIQQAAGMVAVQARISVLDALVLIRAHGFALSVSASSLANRIIARDIRYEPDSGSWLGID